MLFHLFISEPNHMYAVLVQEYCPVCIFLLCFDGIVNASIQFNAESYGRTIEVEYVRAKTMLLPKTVTVKLFSPQVFP